MLKKGLYITLEGADGVGKTSTMEEVAKLLREQYPEDVTTTHHPGSTPLGKHLRKLVKFPKDISEDIEIDPSARQLLYMADTANFINMVLRPALLENKIVLADRSSLISALVYGVAEGISLSDIDKITSAVSTPKADRLYILECPWDTLKARLQGGRKDGTDSTGKLDHFDSKSEQFMQNVSKTYSDISVNNLKQTTLVSKLVSIQDIVHVDSFNRTVDDTANFIASDIFKIIDQRC